MESSYSVEINVPIHGRLLKVDDSVNFLPVLDVSPRGVFIDGHEVFMLLLMM
jgi:hypothetical protein